MESVVALYAAVTGSATALSAVLAGVAWRRRDVPGATVFAAFAAAVAVWTFGATMELVATTFGSALTWNRVAYLGGVLVPPTWVAFTLAYTGRRHLLGPVTYAALAVEPVVFAGLVLGVEPAGLVWTGAVPARTAGTVLADVRYGPLFWAHLAYSYALILAGFGVLLHASVDAPRPHAGQVAALAVAPVAPLLVNVVSVAEAAPLPAADVTAAGIAVGAVPVYLALFRREFLDVLPLARKHVLATLPQGVLVLDSEDRVVTANPAASDLLGRRVAPGTPASALLPGRDVLALALGLGGDGGGARAAGDPPGAGADGVTGDGAGPDAADEAWPADATVTVEGADGPRHLAVTATPVESGGHRLGRVVQFVDVTADRRRRETLSRQREQLAMLNRVVRHDVRNDMNVLLGWAGIAQDRAPPDVAADLDRVLRVAADVVDLTDALRDLEAVTVDASTEDLAAVDLAAVVRGEAEKVRSTTAATVELGPELATGTVHVEGNELLQSVFKNLLDNAVTHAADDPAAVTVSVTLTDRGDRAVVDVTDDGRGVPDERKETVFGRGEKGLDSPGSGVGLYLVDAIVSSCGGRVWVEDADPRGARFRVELGRADRADPAGTNGEGPG